MTINRKITEPMGRYGAIAIVLTQALAGFQLIPSDGGVFKVLNLAAAAGIIVVLLAKGVQQSVVLNTLRAIIAVVAVVRVAVK